MCLAVSPVFGVVSPSRNHEQHDGSDGIWFHWRSFFLTFANRVGLCAVDPKMLCRSGSSSIVRRAFLLEDDGEGDRNRKLAIGAEGLGFRWRCKELVSADLAKGMAVLLALFLAGPVFLLTANEER